MITACSITTSDETPELTHPSQPACFCRRAGLAPAHMALAAMRSSPPGSAPRRRGQGYAILEWPRSTVAAHEVLPVAREEER